MLLMCQEFDMSDCIILWDTLFSDQNRFDFLNYICVSVVLSKRETVIDGDFAECMECLQKSTEHIGDIKKLLTVANRLMTTHKKK